MTTGHDLGSRRVLTLLTWCAAASLGLLFMRIKPAPGIPAVHGNTPVYSHVATYLALLTTAGALVAWHLAPRRSWAWLLLAGAVCAAPGFLLWLLSGSSVGPMPLVKSTAVLAACAPAFTSVGILGAATLVWRAGRQAVGSALLGVAVVMQLIGPLVMGSIQGDPDSFLTMQQIVLLVALVLAVVAGAGAIVALRVGPVFGPDGDRPDRRTTVAGAVAAATPLIAVLWRPDPDAYNGTGLDVDPVYLLYMGLVLLALGVTLGVAAGPRVLLAALSAGLTLGPFALLVAPAVGVLRTMPVLAVVAAAGSLLLGFAAALIPARDRIGAAGLVVVAIGLFVLFGLFNGDGDYQSTAEVLTPILLVIGVVAAVTCLASVGEALAPKGESPAVLVGIATPVSLGAILLITYFGVTGSPDRTPFTNLLPSTAGALLLSALALLLLVNRSRWTGTSLSTPSTSPSTVR